MKTVSPALQAHLQQETTTLATCVKLILTKYQPRIASVTKANPGVVTTLWNHGFFTGDVVEIVGVRGMTALNRNEYQVTRIDRLRFSIDANTSLYDPYEHKGEARKIVGYTDFYKDLVFDGVTYKSTLGYMPQSLKAGSDMALDSIEAIGVMQNAAKQEIAGLLIDGIADDDLIAGRYDNAAVEIFVVNYADLTMGRVVLPISGNLGETALNRGTYRTELSGKTAYLQETLQEVYTAQCRADLGDDHDGSDPADELRPGFGCKVRLDPPLWLPETVYTVRSAHDASTGSVVKSSVYSGRQFVCTTAGASGTEEPPWNLSIGAATGDGTVVWTTIEALTKQGAVYKVIDRRRFIDEQRNEAPTAGLGGVSTLFPITAINQGAKRFTIAGSLAANFPASAKFTVVSSSGNDGTYTVASASESGGSTNIVVSESIPSGTADGAIVGRLAELVGFFAFGKLTFLSGKNVGIAREVKSFSLTSTDGESFSGPGLFELFEALPFDLQIGDRYEAAAGCDKSLSMCVGKFDNVYNRRAEDNIPGMDVALLYPDQK